MRMQADAIDKCSSVEERFCYTGADVQDIFATLTNNGQRYDYAAAVEALNAYFVLLCQDLCN